MDIKTVDLEYLDNLMDNFDVTDSINYNFENWMNIDRFIDFLKRENVYDNFEYTMDLYMRFCHKYDKEDVYNYGNELQEEVVGFIKDSVNECIVESEED